MFFNKLWIVNILQPYLDTINGFHQVLYVLLAYKSFYTP